MKKTFLSLLFLFAFAGVASALELGDNAPAISPESWVTGEAVDPTAPAEDTFYLVEVWSTTCPPCVRSIPILNEMQKKYADQGLKIVSFTTDTREEVEPFLKQHPMEYSSFIDQEGATYINYMAADNRNTIPHAFLFDKSGVLVWIGNPLDKLESRIQQVLDGTLNGEKAIAVREARITLQQAFEVPDMDGIKSSLETLQTLEPDNIQYYQINLRFLSQTGGAPEEISALLDRWYEGCKDNAEGLVVLSVMSMDQMHPDQRNPAMALSAAKRAFSMESDSKLEAGITLAETYKDLGRIDLAVQIIGEVRKLTDDPEEQEIIDAIGNFYERARRIGDNPDSY